MILKIFVNLVLYLPEVLTYFVLYVTCSMWSSLQEKEIKIRTDKHMKKKPGVLGQLYESVL